MDAEKEVERKIEIYGELAKADKKVDATALMLSALEQAQQAEVEAKKKHWAYLISVGLPPFGLFYAVRYALSDKADGKRVAWICVILTVVSLLVAWLIGKLFLSSAGPELNQIQSINPNDLKDMLQ